MVIMNESRTLVLVTDKAFQHGSSIKMVLYIYIVIVRINSYSDIGYIHSKV